MRIVRSAHPDGTRELMRLIHDAVYAVRVPAAVEDRRASDGRTSYGNRHEAIRTAFVRSYHGPEVRGIFERKILDPAWCRLNSTRRYMSRGQKLTLRAVYDGWKRLAGHRLRKGGKSRTYFALGLVTPAPGVEGARASLPYFAFRGRNMPTCLRGVNAGILKYEARRHPPP
jgi:hypothetical protein